MLLSDRGREVAARAARILDDVREMVEFAQHADDLLSGSLRLGVIPSIAPYMLPPLLAAAARGLLHPRAARARDADDAADRGADRGQARRAAPCAPHHAFRDRDAGAVRRSLPAGAAGRAPVERARARDQGSDRARASAFAGGRSLPARPGADLLQSAAGLDGQHVRRLEPVDDRGDGGGGLRHYAVAGDVPQRRTARARDRSHAFRRARAASHDRARVARNVAARRRLPRARPADQACVVEGLHSARGGKTARPKLTAPSS